MQDEFDQARELVEDQRPAYTLWRVTGECARGAPRTVWIFQGEGGSVCEETASAYFEALRHKVAPTSGSFVTLYDFTQPLSNILPFAPQLARNAAEIRSKMRCVRTVIVCTSSAARNVLRFVAGLVGGERPYVIVDSVEKGWEAAFAAEEAGEAALRDDFEGVPLSEGLDPSCALLSAH